MNGDVATENIAAGADFDPGRDAVLATLLSTMEGVVFDIDCSLVLSSQPTGHDGSALPEAVAAVTAIRASGRTVLAFTNASTRPPAEIAASLAAFGFDFGPTEALWAGSPLLVTSDAPAFATAGRGSAGAAGFIATGLSHVGGVEYEVLGKPSALAAAAAPPERRPHLVVNDLGQFSAALDAADRHLSAGRQA